jgi:hypothetical protein
MVNLEVIKKIVELYRDLYFHNGYGEIRIEMKILRRGQKEIIVHCGKQYRFVVNGDNDQELLGRIEKALHSIG